MPDAAKTGVIFLVLGFAVYLAWKNDLAAYLSFATKANQATGGGEPAPNIPASPTVSNIVTGMGGTQSDADIMQGILQEYGGGG